MLLLVPKEVKLGLSLFVLLFFALLVALLDGFQLGLQFNYFVCLFCFLSFKLGDALLQVSLSVLGLQLLTHGERDGANKTVTISLLTSGKESGRLQSSFLFRHELSAGANRAPLH